METIKHLPKRITIRAIIGTKLYFLKVSKAVQTWQVPALAFPDLEITPGPQANRPQFAQTDPQQIMTNQGKPSQHSGRRAAGTPTEKYEFQKKISSVRSRRDEPSKVEEEMQVSLDESSGDLL